MELRPYQTRAKDEIEALWQQGQKNICAVMPTGAGKTVLMSEIVKQHNEPTCVIAHRQELVGQISQSLARNGIHHRIIASDVVIRFCVQQHLKEFGKKYEHSSAVVAVAGVQTIIRRTDELSYWAKSVTLWMQDECFPAGTLVDNIPIQHIKAGMNVNSFNELTGQIEKRQVTRIFKNPMPYHMIRLTIGHHVIECTAGHPIWTENGWTRAQEIRKGDILYEMLDDDSRSNRESAIRFENSGSDILQPPMCFSVPGSDITTQIKSREAETHTCSGVLLVRKRISKIYNTVKFAPTILLKDLFKCLSIKNIINNNVKDQQKILLRANDQEQSNASCTGSREGQQDTQKNESSTPCERGEWQASHKSGSDIIQPAQFNGFRESGYSNNQTIARESSPLQNRLWKSKVENCNRSRRRESQDTTWSESRLKEKLGVSGVRVDCVEIFQSGDHEPYRNCTNGHFVYNIEVEGLHTYIANGIVVHNCHHLQVENQWGKAVDMFPNAKGLGVTATPCRADGHGLSRDSDGVMDSMVVGPSMRELIDQGYLSEYRIFAPPSDIDLDSVSVSSKTGDYVAPQLRDAVGRSHIVGDVVQHYLRIAPGKLGVTFTTDVETAKSISVEFNEAGVPAEVVSGKTPDRVRAEYIDRFRRGELRQLVNVDIFGEGFDLPALEVVSMARPTASYSLFCQQFGRALRVIDGKSHAIIIDHVGNTLRHGLPDAPREWSMDRKAKISNGASDAIPTKACPDCTAVFERTHKECPFCGFYAEPVSRSSPDHVDGDLMELDLATLNRLRKGIEPKNPDDVFFGLVTRGTNVAISNKIVSNIKVANDERDKLRECLGLFRASDAQKGRSEAESYRRFYLKFGVDVLTAQSLPTAKMREITECLI